VRTKRRVFLVDDHPLFRDGLAQLLGKHGFEVCGQADSVADALAWFEAAAAAEKLPAAVITDINLRRGRNGLELIKEAGVRFPGVPILVLSIYDESIYAERALRAGAKGYIHKREPGRKVVEALHCVLEGGVHVSPDLSALMVRQFLGADGKGRSPIERLTDRELEVFQSIGRGHTSRQIAQELHLDPKTIETYRGRIKIKLSLKNATELHQHALRWLEGGRT